MKILEIKNPNDAWIIHREEIETLQDGVCDVYVILDAISGRCFGMETTKDLPSSSKILGLIKTSCSQANTTPKSIFILKKDPLAEVVGAICAGLQINFDTATKKELAQFTEEFSKSFRQFKMGNKVPLQEPEYEDISREEVEAFIPDTYGHLSLCFGQEIQILLPKII